MTPLIVAMIIIGIVFILVSFFVSEKLTKKESDFNIDLLTVDDNYEFSDRELKIIKRKIEDVIANQAKDILYETNESLSSMANEKTMALGDYAVAVCEQIEKNHKEVMFLYSMLDDKQKEIMNTVKKIDETKKQLEEILAGYKEDVRQMQPKSAMPVTANTISESPVTDEKKNVESDKKAQKVEQVPESDLEEEKIASEEDVFQELDAADDSLEDTLEEEFEENANSNDIILEMHRNGNSIIEIAKQLGLGVGEVKLVIDLYQGEKE